MTDSILTSVKNAMDVATDDPSFDGRIIMHINTVLSTLNQLNVGPIDGFMIEDDTPVWNDLLGGDNRLNMVKSYMYTRVRLLFDPPTTGYLVDALKEQILEFEWRIEVTTSPANELPVDEDVIVEYVLDGGAP